MACLIFLRKYFVLKIEAIEPGYKWIDDLRLYAVTDAETGDPLGLIYMDLFPRENKYGHFAQFGVTTGKLLDERRISATRRGIDLQLSTGDRRQALFAKTQ